MSIRNRLPGAFAAAVAMLAVSTGVVAQYASIPSANVPVQGEVGGTSFPDASRSRIRNGDFVNVDNLRQVGRGLGKSQVRSLLGNPHFSEGIGGVSRWDYVFNFRTGADSHVTCQYQVNYRKTSGRYEVESMHWDRPDCLDVLNARPEPVAPSVETITLSADALFGFDRSGPGDILPEGRRQIAELAAQLADVPGLEVTVVGHADRLGSDGYNLDLSDRRAQTVRSLLVEQGIPAGAITAYGRGSTQPVASCSGSQSRDDLVACLAPDRRVEIRVSGER